MEFIVLFLLIVDLFVFLNIKSVKLQKNVSFIDGGNRSARRKPPTCRLLRRPPPAPSIHVYTLFFRIEKNHPEIVFLLETASRDQIYHFIHLTLTNTILGVLHNLYIYILYENKRGR